MAENTTDDVPEGPDHIAVIGMAGRFPGALDVESLWDDLLHGRENIAALSAAELAEAGVAPELLERPDYVKAKGVLDGADTFDAAFFGYSPREAEIMDPQHRVFLECVWTALESAGHDPRAFQGRIGVFAGASLNSYLLFNVLANRAVAESAGAYQTLLASDKDFLATRVSYKLDLRGPSVTVQTACSTSLTAVHLACQSLLNGECDIAVAGGVSVSVPLKDGYLYQQGGILSPDGHCRPFDAAAGGTVAGNGVGVVVLRRLGEALADGDQVDAVIRGSAMNNDGAVKVGYTAPGVDGQAEVIAEAMAVAGVEPGTIGYVEAHGTGTALGDPIEIAALTRAFRERTSEVGFCAVGSVKSNVGHLDAAAGVTALIKAVLVVKHGIIPPTVGFERPNPELALETSPFVIAAETRPWPATASPRRAGVSSFGIGGTNVHVVLEEPPVGTPGGPGRQVHALPLSARSPQALAESADRLADHLDRHPEADLGDVAFTLGTRRRAFDYRRTVVAGTPGQAVAALRGVTASDAVAAADGAPVAFLFPGQGAQYPGMTRDLYEHEPYFAAEFDHCAELFAEHLGEDLRTLVFPAADDADAAARLAQTAFTQPVMFAVEYALARLLCEWGVRPRAMAGHSIGEYAAACLAGVLSLPDAVRVVAARGRLVQARPGGAMLAVMLPEAETTGLLGDDLCLAAVNSTAMCVVAGPEPAIEDLRVRLTAAEVGCSRLHTSHAFHSPDMDEAVAPLVEELRAVRLNPPSIPFVSNVTGTWITDEEATDPAYWGRQLRRPVRFADAIGELLRESGPLLEVGPGRTLAGFVQAHRDWTPERVVATTLRHPRQRQDDREVLLQGVGALWSAGANVDWAACYAGEDRRRLRLPGYPFQRQRYWVTPDPASSHGRSAAPVPAAGPSSSEPTARTGPFYTPTWRRLPHDGRTTPCSSRVVVLGADLALGRALAESLEAQGATVVRVRAAAELRREGDLSWAIDPADRAHYAAVLEETDEPVRLAHLWSLATDPAGDLDERLETGTRMAFDGLLALAQGIGDARPAHPVAIDVLCRGVHEVTGDEPAQPENALLLGPATVIPQEVADVTCRTLDITGVNPHDPDAQAVTAISAMLRRDEGHAPDASDAASTGSAPRDLALRGRYWWARGFEPLSLAQGDGVRLRPDGVYLITGGLGGVGLALAEHLAEAIADLGVPGAAGPVLALLGRSPFPAEDTWDDLLDAHPEQDAVTRRVRRLVRLRERGVRIVTLQADVADIAETAKAVAELRDRFGPVNGVIHAAGVPSRGLIMGKSREDAAAVLAAKTRGTLVLDRVCAGDDLDFFLLCSSRASVVGGPGQSDYAAANAFLDVFARWRRSRTGAVVSAIGWDTWRGVGMAAGLAAGLGGGLGGGRATGHPLLHRLVEETGDARSYVTEFSTADDWIVDEHRIMGHGLVPGTAYLELVRAAVAEQAAGRVVELHDVLFTMPLIVPDGRTREVVTTVRTDSGTTRFAVRGRAGDGGDWQEHASGTITFHERAATETRRDLEQVRRECGVTEVIGTEDELKRRLKLDVVERGERIRFDFGPRWRCLREIQAGEGRLFVTLRLDDAYLGDLDEYALHPALLDVAGAAARVQGGDVYYLPLTYRRLRVHAGLTATVFGRVELKERPGGTGETLTCDIDLYDPDGRLLVEITGFTIKRINDLDALVGQIERLAAAPDAESVAGGALHALSRGMSARDCVAAFARVLAAPDVPAHLLVSGGDLVVLERLARSLTPAQVIREAERIAPSADTHPRPDLATPYVAPATDEEQAVAEIWREVLGLDRVGLNDDFFALGGHSLAAVQIGSKLAARYDVRLELRDFFDTPTVAGTVAALAKAGRTDADDDDPIPVLRRERDDGGHLDGLDGLDDLDDLDIDGLTDAEVDARLRELLAEESGRPEGND
ncbi:SDR family NAD(P)-dependent oxidoreductase [Thermopolyspora sp. NPDC052614]|uniref:type I polyketide synthase n=1 Tax=Thermopolyspora sp. NPDC052614 TaxID=3155682 RepID=UPI003448DE25